MFIPDGLYMSVVVIIVMWLVSVVLKLLMFMPGGLYMSVVVIIVMWLVSVVLTLLVFMPGGMYMSVVVIIVMWLVSVVLTLLMFMPGGLYMSVVVIIVMLVVSVVLTLLVFMPGGMYMPVVVIIVMWLASVVVKLLMFIPGGMYMSVVIIVMWLVFSGAEVAHVHARWHVHVGGHHRHGARPSARCVACIRQGFHNHKGCFAHYADHHVERRWCLLQLLQQDVSHLLQLYILQGLLAILSRLNVSSIVDGKVHPHCFPSLQVPEVQGQSPTKLTASSHDRHGHVSFRYSTTCHSKKHLFHGLLRIHGLREVGCI